MKKRYLAIGGLLLPEDPAWKFMMQEGVIVGKRKDDPGIFQILHASQDTLPQPVTHEFCLQVLRVMLKGEEEPTERQMGESICGPYGAATFKREREVMRGWYCRRPPGLIYGVYACPATVAKGPGYTFITARCALIMAEVLFDRASWGFEDDPLTKVLLENFERLEHERPEGPHQNEEFRNQKSE